MARFVNSNSSIPSSLLLWNDRPTQVSIEETYDLKVWPVTNLLNEGPINFSLPIQMNGLLTDVHIITKFKIQKNGEDITTPQKDISVINNFANSLWSEVSVICDDRVELCQSLKNAYPYQTFFNHALNSENNRADYLFENELIKMDEGMSKKSEEDLRVFWKWNHYKDSMFDDLVFEEGQKKAKIEEKKEGYWGASIFNDRPELYSGYTGILSDRYSGDALKIAVENEMEKRNAWIPTRANPAASIRSTRVNRGQSVILNSKFQCPLLNTSKCLPTKIKIRLSLTKNRDEFLLLCNDDAGYSIVLEDVYLNVTYYRVRDQILSLIEERLAQEPAPYFISRPELIVRPVTHASRIIRMSDIFKDKLPPFAFFALQRSVDFEGKFSSNCYTFWPFKKFQFYRDGVPYFSDPLEVATINEARDGDFVYRDFGEYMRQLYRTIGKDSRGNCLINSTNFHLNFMVGMSFGADRSSLAERHLNLQEKASTYLEIDMGIDNVPEDLILIVYAVFDRQVQIDSNRMVRIIE